MLFLTTTPASKKARIATAWLAAGLACWVPIGPGASAATWTQAGLGITRIDSGTDGNLLVADQAFTESCASANIGRIDAASPDLNRILALATVAFTSGMKVQFFVNGCTGGGGTMVGKITDIRVSK